MTKSTRICRGRLKRKSNGGHPSLDIVSTRGTELVDKKIVLCVAGSVAAYKAIELARMLMRHGADVTCVVSDAAAKLVRPEYFRWATGNPAVTKLTGNLEHVRLADYGKANLIAAYPATANTLGKLAAGIDDSPVSTVLTVGLGSKTPILVCLAMHASMYENAAVKRNVAFLRKKIEFLEPRIIEGKAKAPEPEDVLDHILKRFGHSSVLRGRRILITAGPTIERVDPVRVITNMSTGKTGVSLAREMISAGARVTVVYGPGREEPPRGARYVPVLTSREMMDAVEKEVRKGADIVIMAAAVSDYTVRSPSKRKISSAKEEIALRLVRNPKIINRIKEICGDLFLVGFKAEAGLSKEGLEKRAIKKMRESGSDMMIANDLGDPRYEKDSDSNQVLIIAPGRKVWSGWKRKEDVARIITGEIEKEYGRRTK